MNFVQNKSLQQTAAAALGYESGGDDDDVEEDGTERAIVRPTMLALPNGQRQHQEQHPPHQPQHQTNGVIKVAMYGEFPITATTSAVAMTNNHVAPPREANGEGAVVVDSKALNHQDQ